VQTVTGDEDSTGSSSSSSSTRPGVELERPGQPAADDRAVRREQEHLDEAGPAELQLVASDDVVKVRLSLDGVELAELTPGDFPHEWEALSAKDNGLARSSRWWSRTPRASRPRRPITLERVAAAVRRREVLFEDPVKGAVISVISALKYTPDAIIAVGTRDTGAGLRLTVMEAGPGPLRGGAAGLAEVDRELDRQDRRSRG
jgi:hypothetical protein